MLQYIHNVRNRFNKTFARCNVKKGTDSTPNKQINTRFCLKQRYTLQFTAIVTCIYHVHCIRNFNAGKTRSDFNARTSRDFNTCKYKNGATSCYTGK